MATPAPNGYDLDMTRATVDRIGESVLLAVSGHDGTPVEVVFTRDHARDLGQALVRKASEDGHDALDDLVERCNT